MYIYCIFVDSYIVHSTNLSSFTDIYGSLDLLINLTWINLLEFKTEEDMSRKMSVPGSIWN